MELSYVLFGIGFIWVFFATVQDLKTREIANWLTFSLISFGLVVRAYYALAQNNISVFLYGAVGTLLFVCIAFGMYYSRVFAGGDAKLLMGIGTLLPYTSFFDIFLWGFFFLFLLSFSGAFYSIFYSVFLVIPVWKTFKGNFLERICKVWFLFVLCILLSAFLALFAKSFLFWSIGTGILLIVPVLYAYLQTLENVCMKKLRSPSTLSEGEWLVHDVKCGGKTIKASVHGVSLDDIRILKKFNRKVLVKEGIPFVPAFLLALILTVWVSEVLRVDLYALLASLAQ